MVKDVSVKFVSMYNGHTLSKNGKVDLRLICDYSELVNYMQLVQMLNNDINIAVKLPGEKKPIKIGMFRLKYLNISHDGSAKIGFSSTNDFVEVNELNNLVTDERFVVRCESKIEIENEGEDE